MKTNNLNEHISKVKIRIKEQLDYEFKDNELLLEALTHSSFKNDTRANIIIDNQKLEFMGDSVLNLIASSFLLSFNEYSKSEGELTVRRSQLVKQSSLVLYANIISLAEFLIISESASKKDLHKLDSSLADAFEALVGAIYLDSNYNTVEYIIKNKFYDNFIYLLEEGDSNYKGRVNELINKIEGYEIEYSLLSADGPDHEKIFTTELKLNGKCIGKGVGNSILQSEQKAAKQGEIYLKEKFDV